MNRITAFVIAGALSAASFAQDNTSCPALLAKSGIEWQYQRGPDFGVCYAVVGKERRQLFGLYIGMAPNFHAKDHSKAEAGSVAGIAVQWYLVDSNSRYSRATVLAVRSKAGSNYQTHVWIEAKNAEQLLKAKSVLSAMRFRD